LRLYAGLGLRGGDLFLTMREDTRSTLVDKKVTKKDVDFASSGGDADVPKLKGVTRLFFASSEKSYSP